GSGHLRIEDERDFGVLRGLREQRAHDRGLARSDLAGELDESASLVDTVQQMSESFGVAFAQIEIARIRGDRERLLVQAEEGQVHEPMLLDAVTAPQRVISEPGPGLIERGVQASEMRDTLEQPELRGGTEITQDHPQQSKFRAG